MMFPVMAGEMEVAPVFLSTVTPGKFPVRWFNPVSTLNSEVFPLLGFPTNAIWTVFFDTMRFAKVACNHCTRLRDQEFCVKGNEKNRMKKMKVFRAKPLWQSIFAVRQGDHPKGKIQNLKRLFKTMMQLLSKPFLHFTF